MRVNNRQIKFSIESPNNISFAPGVRFSSLPSGHGGRFYVAKMLICFVAVLLSLYDQSIEAN